MTKIFSNLLIVITKKIFRQINYLVIFLVKTLLSRNFCQKCVRLNRSNFHTVTLWYRSLKKFVKSILIYKRIESFLFLNKLISRNFHTTYKIPWNSFTRKLYYSELIWRKNLLGARVVNFSFFHSTLLYAQFHFGRNYVKSKINNRKLYTSLLSRNIFQVEVYLFPCNVFYVYSLCLYSLRIAFDD